MGVRNIQVVGFDMMVQQIRWMVAQWMNQVCGMQVRWPIDGADLMAPIDGDMKIHQWLKQMTMIPISSKIHGKQVFSHVSFLCWHLWLARNSLYFENLKYSPQDVICRAEKDWKEFWTLKNPGQVVSQNFSLSSSPAVYWSPPPPGFYKLNTDAAYQEKSQSGIGFIIRQPDGVVSMACSKQMMVRATMAIGEALAIREGLSIVFCSWYK
ncbi:hypothetical protein NE237_031442 [Protea cynaroides]|uniref:RNase H type-1 domain-containing protein n=1 Tax=Protea cynaroides TaxID=273540 RepID=A0A9Q0R244_9MAGN|nr:hypothetical protein NE237_031442 [Protea cynaroides]